MDLSAYTPDLPSAFADPRVASWVLDTLSERALATSGAVGGLEEQEVEESLPKAYVEFSRVSEFLRHFHAFHHRRLSGQASEEVCAKLERLVEKMDQKNKELAALRTSLHKTYKVGREARREGGHDTTTSASSAATSATGSETGDMAVTDGCLCAAVLLWWSGPERAGPHAVPLPDPAHARHRAARRIHARTSTTAARASPQPHALLSRPHPHGRPAGFWGRHHE